MYYYCCCYYYSTANQTEYSRANSYIVSLVACIETSLYHPENTEECCPESLDSSLLELIFSVVDFLLK